MCGVWAVVLAVEITLLPECTLVFFFLTNSLTHTHVVIVWTVAWQWDTQMIKFQSL